MSTPLTFDFQTRPECSLAPATGSIPSFFFPHWVRGGDLIAKTKIVCPSWYRLRWRETKDEAGRVVEISCDPPCRFELSNAMMSQPPSGDARRDG